MTHPTILASTTHYYVLYRTDLGSQVHTHIKILPEPMLLLEIRVDPIYAEEMRMTEAWKDSDIAMPRPAQISKFVPVRVPTDALLGSSSVARKDYDTPFGRLFELVIPKFKASTFSVGPPQQQLKQQERAETAFPLHKAATQ